MRPWPALPYEVWRDTCDTLHAHAQVLGKLAVVLAPPEPELQHAALRLTARGWETRPLPAPDGSGAFVVALDLHSHVARVEHSEGKAQTVALTPDRAVADVTRELLETVRAMAGPVELDLEPQEVPWSVPLDEDREHARWEESLGQYLLDWDDVRAAHDPHAAALAFARSAFRHACSVCGWDAGLAASAEGRPPPVS